MLGWIVSAFAALVAWLCWLLVGELLGEIFWAATAPMRRPIRAAFIAARWPWPLLCLLGIGAVSAVGGLWIMRDDRGLFSSLGVVLFLGGSGVALLAPLLWRDSRRVRSGGPPRHG